VQERIKLFGSIGLPGKNVEVVVPGCSTSAKLPSTSVIDLGLASGSVSLGSCVDAQEMVATVVPGVLDNRKFSASVFPSPNSGFGIISGQLLYTPSRCCLRSLIFTVIRY
jgi:hypothetical protein